VLLVVVGLTGVPRHLPGVASFAILGGSWTALVLAMRLPRRGRRAGVALARRLGDFRHAVNAVGDQPTRADLEGLLRLVRDLDLPEHDVLDELRQIRATLDALALRDQLEQGTLPTVAGAERVPPGDRCHFLCPVRSGRRRSDQFGHLMLTGGWLKFRGPLDVSVTWSEVLAVQRAGHDVIVELRDHARVLRFSCPTIEDATRASVLADHLTRSAPRDEPRPESHYQAAL
jgi:hypothetical protein